MSTPEHLRYSATHQWARHESDGLVSVGITDHAQEQLGDVVFVQNPALGSRLKQGDACGVVESVKAASDIYSPVSGEVVAINEQLSDAPEQINDDPYAAWMFRIQPDDVAEMDNLLDAKAYQKVAEAEKN
ncbi:MAG: glycine cleavage system protein GcvH [Pseudomonadota bacterium]